MAMWDIWLVDDRPLPLPPTELILAIQARLASRGLHITGRPRVLIPPERYPGQSIVRVRDDRDVNYSWAKMRIVDALVGTRYHMKGKPFLVTDPKGISEA
jgi:hypothetical protein